MSSSSVLTRCCAVNIENRGAQRDSEAAGAPSLGSKVAPLSSRLFQTAVRTNAAVTCEGWFPCGSHVGRADVRLVCSNARARCRYSVGFAKGVLRECQNHFGISVFRGCVTYFWKICGDFKKSDEVKWQKIPYSLWFIFFFSEGFPHVLHGGQFQPMIGCRITVVTKA